MTWSVPAVWVCVGDIGPWIIWGYYLSPMMYGQTAIVINEFLDKRWSTVSSLGPVFLLSVPGPLSVLFCF